MASSEDNEGRQLIVEEGNKEARRKAPSLLQIVNCAVLVSSVICLSVSIGCAQALGGIVPPFELNLWRYLAEFLMVTPLVVKRCLVLPERRHVVPLLVVCVSSWAYNILFYTAGTYLPLGTATAGDSGFWLVFTGLVTLVVFRECTKYLTMAVISCLIGVVLLTQPEFIFPDSPVSVYNPVCKREYQPSNQTRCGNQSYINESSKDIAAAFLPNMSSLEDAAPGSNLPNGIVGLGLIIGAGASNTLQSFVANKKLGEMNSLTLNFWVSGSGVLVSGVITAIFEKPTLPTSIVCVTLLLGHALATGIENITEMYCLLVFSPVVRCLAFQMPSVLSYVAQCTFMKSINPGKQNAAEIAGIVLVIFGNVIVACGELYTLCVADPVMENK